MKISELWEIDVLSDLNECTAGTDGCSQNCVNVDGGFNCECEFGYTLGDDRKTCIKGI